MYRKHHSTQFGFQHLVIRVLIVDIQYSEIQLKSLGNSQKIKIRLETVDLKSFIKAIRFVKPSVDLTFSSRSAPTHLQDT